MDNAKFVEANPTKDFFIYMITRDIDTKPAIVELIDNAIDGAKRIRNNGDYSGLNIDLSFDGNSFTIEDNCGGFDLEIARKYAFKFGRPNDREQEKGLFTGLFGIGMKRALFKLGRKFTISSTTEKTHFKVVVDVDKWKDDPSWNFPLQDVVADGCYSECERGTIIEIENLYDEQKINFSNKVFENSLFAYIQMYRSVGAENGLTIRVNGNKVNFFRERLIENENIKCYKNLINNERGEVRIIAGVAHNGTPEYAGWYVFCNERLVLFADKTSVTGWGKETRAYHNHLASFRGYVYFESENLLQLPWNTTKTGVDTTNKLYQETLEKMKEAISQINRAINSMLKKYDVNNIDEIASIKNASEITLSYETVHGFSIASDFEIKDQKSTTKKANTTISFKVPKDKYEIVKAYMNSKTAKEMGETLFDYYCEMEDVFNGRE